MQSKHDILIWARLTVPSWQPSCCSRAIRPSCYVFPAEAELINNGT